MVGQLIRDRYRILDTLNTSAVATTYLAQDQRYPELVHCTIQEFQPRSQSHCKAAWQQFATEVAQLRALDQHDRLPDVVEAFQIQGRFYLVQNWVEAEALTVELGDRWCEAQVMQFLEAILALLQAAHDGGVWHRNLKPSNIMRRSDDQQWVLTDFGGVQQLPCWQRDAANPYQAPEQAGGHPRSNSDVYALGMMAIQALTGLSPDQLRRDAQGEWQWQAPISAALAAVIRKMVRSQHGDRFVSVEATLAALQTAQAEEPLPVKPFTPPMSAPFIPVLPQVHRSAHWQLSLGLRSMVAA